MRVILESDVVTVKKWKSVFEDAGIITAVVRPDFNKSWKTKLLLAVADSQLEKARSFLDQDFLDSLSDREKEISKIVADHNASHVKCPGCLTEFETGPSEGPECGLFLGLP